MRALQLTCDGRDVCVAEIAESHWTRFHGLMLQPQLAEGRGLWILPSTSVHTFFMRFPIDLVYLSRDCRIVRLCRRVPPWRLSFGGRGAHSVIELTAGAIDAAGLALGAKVDAGPVHERGPELSWRS